LISSRDLIDPQTYYAIWDEIDRNSAKLSPRIGAIYKRLQGAKMKMRNKLPEFVTEENQLNARRVIGDVTEAQYADLLSTLRENAGRWSQGADFLSTSLVELAKCVDLGKALERLYEIPVPLRLMRDPQRKIQELERSMSLSNEEALVMTHIELIGNFPPIDVLRSQEAAQTCRRVADFIRSCSGPAQVAWPIGSQDVSETRVHDASAVVEGKSKGTCDLCHAENPADSKFCRKCGAPLEGTEEETRLYGSEHH